MEFYRPSDEKSADGNVFINPQPWSRPSKQESSVAMSYLDRDSAARTTLRPWPRLRWHRPASPWSGNAAGGGVSKRSASRRAPRPWQDDRRRRRRGVSRPTAGKWRCGRSTVREGELRSGARRPRAASTTTTTRRRKALLASWVWRWSRALIADSPFGRRRRTRAARWGRTAQRFRSSRHSHIMSCHGGSWRPCHLPTSQQKVSADTSYERYSPHSQRNKIFTKQKRPTSLIKLTDHRCEFIKIGCVYKFSAEWFSIQLRQQFNMCLYMTIYDEWCRFSLVNSRPILTLVIQVSTFHKYFILVSCSRTPTSKQVEIAPSSDTRIFSFFFTF